MIRINQIKIRNDKKRIMNSGELHSLLMAQAAKLLRVDKKQITNLEIIRHSIDARKKPDIFDIYMIDVSAAGDENKILKRISDKNISACNKAVYKFPYKYSEKENYVRPVIIGEGPAGIFCGYSLALAGFKPLILERGEDVDKRSETVEHFWKTGELNVRSNVQFGEGGAGTFSDGKLNTMVKDKDGRGRAALKIFTDNGAPMDILYDAKPHIGTDVLKDVVKSMREKIVEAGGEVRFNTKVSDIILDDNNELIGLKTENGDIDCNIAVLAIGHSARDTFEALKTRKVEMSPKPFAVGFRVEHPQKLINYSQYGDTDPVSIGAAPYKLTTTTNEGRGVYSFCMCPGGYVVNASSEDKRLAVNGMSYSGRNGKNANSAIIITVDPADFGSDDVLSGVSFQRKLEEKAYDLAGGRVPVETYGDFKKGINYVSSVGNGDNTTEKGEDSSFIDSMFEGFGPEIKGEYCFGDVHTILPDDLNNAFVQGMEKFGRMIKGYNNPRTIISGIESRTSSPVRILRNPDGESVNIRGLYPCGEGAGYAGGIMSAAMDGMKIAECVAERLV